MQKAENAQGGTGDRTGRPQIAGQVAQNEITARIRRAAMSSTRYRARNVAGEHGTLDFRAENILWLASLPADDPRQKSIAMLRLGESNGTPDRISRALEISEAAALCSYSRMTIYRALRAGVLRSVTPVPGGRQRILESDLRAWLRGDISEVANAR